MRIQTADIQVRLSLYTWFLLHYEFYFLSLEDLPVQAGQEVKRKGKIIL